MNKKFHKKAFDQATQLKLDIFRQYIREWVPVFLSKKFGNGAAAFKQINLYDYFSGPGTDAKGAFGSPLIIQEEIKAFCAAKSSIKADVPVRMMFNDIEEEFIAELQQHVSRNRCEKPCCSVEFSAQPFQDLLSDHLPEMKQKGHANLILLDQFGVKEVTPEIIRSLLDCGMTDILFFISSAYINRFVATPEFQRRFSIDPAQLKDVEYNAIHRFICEYYRSSLGGSDALVAPFSIKKGSNIYGVIFASRDLLGMEKFLKVCWTQDVVAGSANYNIDNEISYAGDALFPEYNKTTRISVFERDILKFIQTNHPNNIELYRFCLENGFHSSKANGTLSELQEKGRIEVRDAESGGLARKKSFYLTDREKRVIYEAKQWQPNLL